MRVVEDDTERGHDLADVQARISELQRNLDDVNVQLMWDQAVRELHTHDAWRRLAERITEYRVMALDQIASRRMDGYELGQVQGRLAMLRVLTQTRPIPMEQLDKIKQYASDLESQLREERNLLR